MVEAIMNVLYKCAVTATRTINKAGQYSAAETRICCCGLRYTIE